MKIYNLNAIGYPANKISIGVLGDDYDMMIKNGTFYLADMLRTLVYICLN